MEVTKLELTALIIAIVALVFSVIMAVINIGLATGGVLCD